jgi:hypothetical protein
MRELHLHRSLSHPELDALVQEVIQVYEQSFPGQIAAYYVEGSYADHTALSTSDLDLVIIFRHRFEDREARRHAEYAWTGQHMGTQETDLTIIEEEKLRAGVPPHLKLSGQLLYGEDICRHYPLVPIQDWARERMHAAYWLLLTVYHRPTPLLLPLTFPSPSEEFYGYTNRTLLLSDGQQVPCTRNLVRTTGWAATALLALQAGQYASNKRDAVRRYREAMSDQWSAWLEELTTCCRERWHYLLPSSKEEREHLRALCEGALRFEQHFLTCYKAYLLEQLRSPEPEVVRFARWVQQQIPLADPEVIARLETPGQQEEPPPDVVA